MPATLPITTMDDRLAEVNQQVILKRNESHQAWGRFESARKLLGNGHDSDALAAAERASNEYDRHVEELHALEKRRDSYVGLLRGKGRGNHFGRRASGESPEPGEWLHAEIQRMGEFFALGSGAGLGNAVTPIDQPDAFFDLLAPQSVGLASGFSVIETDRVAVA